MTQLKNLSNHALQNPFVFATAVAAFLHSTWTVSMFFGGLPPDAAFTREFIGWLLPGVLLAFSLDIGLLSTANKLARGDHKRGLRVTFFTLAAFMFTLQWVYLIHHTPALTLSEGIRPEWREGIQLLRDMIIWILPALLPISVTLYTFSAGSDEQTTPAAIVTPALAQEANTETARPTQPPQLAEPSSNGHAKRVTVDNVEKS